MLVLIVFFTAIGLGVLVPWLGVSIETLDGRHAPINIDTWLFMWVWFMSGATSLALAGACWYYW